MQADRSRRTVSVFGVPCTLYIFRARPSGARTSRPHWVRGHPARAPASCPAFSFGDRNKLNKSERRAGCPPRGRDVRDPSADETSALRGPTQPPYLLQIGTTEMRIRSSLLPRALQKTRCRSAFQLFSRVKRTEAQRVPHRPRDRRRPAPAPARRVPPFCRPRASSAGAVRGGCPSIGLRRRRESRGAETAR